MRKSSHQIFREVLSDAERGIIRARTSYIYLGIWTCGDVTFFKAGKSNDPSKRAKQFGTSLPGGLTRMLAVAVRNAGMAFRGEFELLKRLLEIPGAQHISGEWIQVRSSDLEAGLAIFGQFGENEEVSVHPPMRRTMAVALSDLSDVEDDYRRANAMAQKLIEEKTRKGVAGLYSGTNRG